MPVIVISGQPGCGSSTTTRLLAKKLRLKRFSVGDYNKRVARKFASGKESQRALSFWKTRYGSSRKFHVDSDKMSLKVAKKGNVVIDGKLAIKLLKGHYDVAVWLKAPKNIRAERYAKRDKLKLNEAKRILKDKERLERRNWKRIYGFDYFKQDKIADIVIDAGKKTPVQRTNEIIRFLKTEGS